MILTLNDSVRIDLSFSVSIKTAWQVAALMAWIGPWSQPHVIAQPPVTKSPVTKSPATQSPTAQTPAAQPPATQSPAGNKPPDGVPGSLDEVQFQQELERLDGICAKLKLEAERKLMNGWLVSDVSDARVLFLPVTSDPLPLPASSPAAAAHASWLKHFSAARARHAQHWFETAQQQATAGDEWAAYRSLWRAAREDSSHAETKRALGTLLPALQVRGKPRPVTTVHPQFKWPAGSYSRMETTNFKITSRADAQQTQRIAARLEAFYALWTQAFYPLWAPPGVAAERLAGRGSNWQRRQQVDVVLCKDREDYLQTLGVAESNIGVSVGFYSPEARLSFSTQTKVSMPRSIMN